MRIYRVTITWSIAESQAANMPESELEKLTDKLVVVGERLEQYARDNTPAETKIDID